MEDEKKPLDNNETRSHGAGQGTAATAARSTGDVENAVDKAKGAAKTLLDQAKSTAGAAYGSVADKAASTMEEQKAGLTGGLTTVADTVRRVSGTIGDGEAQNSVTEYAAKYSETAAQKIEEAAHYFEQTDLRGIARDVETYARRNPAIFLGGAFVLGILVARFLKSGTPPSIENADRNSERQFASGGKWENGEASRATGAM